MNVQCKCGEYFDDDYSFYMSICNKCKEKTENSQWCPIFNTGQEVSK